LGNLKVLQDKIGHPGIEMDGGASPIDPMILIGIKLHLFFFVKISDVKVVIPDKSQL